MENLTSGAAMPQLPIGFFVVLGIILIYSIILKGIALWKAARNGQKNWFIIMLIVNTAGILELLYIFIFSKKDNKQSNE